MASTLDRTGESCMRIVLSAATLLALMLAGCSGLRGPRCGSDDVVLQELIYFGAQTPHDQVEDEDWADFLAVTVTPRFPDGLSVWPAAGQWRSSSGQIVQEPSRVLSLVHPPGSSVDAAIEEIVQAYKSRFEQEAVLRVTSHACMSL
jgi:hypothetical protein